MPYASFLRRQITPLTPLFSLLSSEPLRYFRWYWLTPRFHFLFLLSYWFSYRHLTAAAFAIRHYGRHFRHYFHWASLSLSRPPHCADGINIFAISAYCIERFHIDYARHSFYCHCWYYCHWCHCHWFFHFDISLILIASTLFWESEPESDRLFSSRSIATIDFAMRDSREASLSLLSLYYFISLFQDCWAFNTLRHLAFWYYSQNYYRLQIASIFFATLR